MGSSEEHSTEKSVPPSPTNGDSELHRRLSSRHVTMIALGSSIGMGLWLGSGTSLANGGPAALFIGYILSGTMIWSVSQSIGEMAIMYPLPSAFVQWTNKFVDPAAGFALGWCYWFSWWITIANELAGLVTVLGFWEGSSKIPTGGWIAIFLVVIVLVNICAVNYFAETEVVFAAIKFGWIFVIIITMIVISAGGAPKGGPIGFKYWDTTHGFTNGFKGFLDIMPTCIFAMSGSEACGLVAAETENPRQSVPKAVNSIWIRLGLFYVVGSLMITITVSPYNENLFGGTGTNASPFVIAYRDSGLEPLAHIMNFIIFISVLSTGSISAYSGARTLVGLSEIGMAPKKMRKADRIGRPWWALVPTLIIGGGLAFLNVDQTGTTVFTWFSNLTSLITLFGWAMICFSHIRMRHAWKVQGRSVDELPWKTWTFPVAAWWGLGWCILLVIAEFYLSIWPLGDSPSAKNFFANFVSIIAGVVIWLGARLYYYLTEKSGWWVNSRTIDLDAGRRFYSADQKAFGWIRRKI
ncbi:hypothetical protein M406DRAFT_60918 [Cryphonectria parasitica EP155]|uniref:Amino acid permease/ SLC12A domain-containing protein n=1 Tax=Cryphonectria parasitica (strain ATCC 38755 / EP155) TaxID=660469 RepID=A0A9P5CQ23_CRYP1|nr:uncharacterized protein M406DRAFT_60918 [Cryphonectria parasitica EP155]KAF3766758.1 hypothetical protein M406DRAFT_60918 [Cryphonectria parasitica EP155]